MKKPYLVLCASFALVANVNAVGIGGIANGALNSALGSLDSKFSYVFSNSLNLANACFNTDYKWSVDVNDVCAMASKLDSLKVNVCSAFGGNANVGISGFQSLCNAKLREFNDYSSRQAVNFAEWAMLQEDGSAKDFVGLLPNGMSLNNFNKTWDVNNLLKSGDTPVSNLLKDGRMKEVELFMDYAKSYNAKQDVGSIKIDDIKAPKDLNSYKRGVDESIKNHRAIMKNANPAQSAALARVKLNQDSNANVKELASQLKSDYDNAKIAEIGNTLATSDYKRIAIPTQEYVELLRKDLQPKAIYQIRQQQAYEVATITQIEEKWERRYNLAKLLIDKETILAQTFDEKEAKKEIDKIANGGI